MKILGLDLGTNSLGWAVVEKIEKTESFKLLHKGVRIFQEGVHIEKGNEISRAAQRTEFRSKRRLYFRRRLRKINVLKILTKYNYCPEITDTELDAWRYKKIYPVSNTAFMEWQKTNEADNKNPYFYRAIAATKKLDLNSITDRYILGRALYHITQRRGFLSNRLDTTTESDGIVHEGIEQLSKEKEEKTLGQYFYELYEKGEKIRGKYTHREKHYLEEFETICKVQQLPEDFSSEIKKEIFKQQPLKSQKGNVGYCTFEKNKTRCPASHPLFEEFRMYGFINNIKIKTPEDETLRMLTHEEKEKIIPLFLRKSKSNFKFEDIAKKLTPKGFKYTKYTYSERDSLKYFFNYHLETNISGNKTAAQFKSIFGENWKDEITEKYRLGKGKTQDQIINDIWHVLYFFDNENKVVEFAKKNLSLNKEEATAFSKIKLDKNYASLSLKAIKNILPYLKEGYLFSHAVILANLKNIIPIEIWEEKENKNAIIKEIVAIIESQNIEKKKNDLLNGLIEKYREEGITLSDNAHWQSAVLNDVKKSMKSLYTEKSWKNMDEELQEKIINNAFEALKKQMDNPYGKPAFIRTKRTDERIKEFLKDNFDIDEKKLRKLYHPSDIEVYKPAEKNAHNEYRLGSPLISSIKNPMAMRGLHQLRKVVNELLKEKIIDPATRVHIEMARELNSANERYAIRKWQNERKELHDKYKQQIIRDYRAATGKTIEPTDTDILKYQLWEEQKHICIYTGKTIGITDFLGENPNFDIEHTIPRSISFDNSQSNRTLCEKEFNRKTKRNKIPSQLNNYDEILLRIEHWKKKRDEAYKNAQLYKMRAKQNSDNKEAKDRAIRQKNYFMIEYGYWNKKYGNFLQKNIPDGFKSSQIVDTGIITKYTRLYLKSLFDNVYTVKGQAVSDFRKIWGLQDIYSKKERKSHVHHCIDAITIACMTKEAYETVANIYHQWEDEERVYADNLPNIDKPWEKFTEDVMEIENEILVSHYTPNPLPKQTKKKLRKRGVIIKDSNGKPIYQQGNTIRGSLHKETNYGAIVVKEKYDGKETDKIVYVVRKAVDNLESGDIKNIVDEQIRSIIENGKKIEKEIQTTLKNLNKKLSNEENETQKDLIKNEIENTKSKLLNIYSIKNKDGSLTPIKKVRCIAKTVTDPLAIKIHRDISKKDYKQHSYFVNDGNYIMGIYESKENRTKRKVIVVNNFEAGQYFTINKKKNRKERNPFSLLPEKHPKTGFPLKRTVKTGTLVLFWDKEPEELYNLEYNELNKRLYKVIILNKDGRLKFKHHMEARNEKELTEDYKKENNTDIVPKSLTTGESTVNFEKPHPYLRISPANFSFLVENIDFYINSLGFIHFYKNYD